MKNIILLSSLVWLITACDQTNQAPQNKHPEKPTLPPKEEAPPPKPVPPLEPEPIDDLRVYFHNQHPNHPTTIKMEFGEISFQGLTPEKAQTCQAWRKRKPCWQENDLETYAEPLTQDDLDNLLDIVLSSDVMHLKYDQYGKVSKKNKKPYADTNFLTIYLNGKEREFIYRATKKGEKVPKALMWLETALLQYGRSLRARVNFGEQRLIYE